MAALYLKINLLLNDKLDRHTIDLSDLFAIGQMYEQINENEKALIIYNTCFSSNKFRGDNLMNLCKHMAVLYRKQEQWNDATNYWKIGAELDDMESCIALAKYNEHILKNIGEALAWVEKAENLMLTSPIPIFRKKRLIYELGLRKQRLERSDKHVQE
jgi:tetratricopeptide (TPR) repeat protein